MNTIASARWNDSHGPAVVDLIDRAGAELNEKSPGCALFDGLWADCWDGCDPWGSTLEAAFALEYACQWWGLPTHDEFSSPYTTGDPDEGYLYVGVRDSIGDGLISNTDIDTIRSVLDRLRHGLELAGLDY